MPKLIIDNIPVEVPTGTNVLEAARSVGIVIPHFCYHPALPVAGACRLCAVKLLDGPVKGIQMSCSLAAQDGMVVSTTDPEALKLRALVIEWLMINHPHDCPVCDEGGECLLQDFTIAGGHSRRRYRGKKRTHENQYLGEGIYHEMNRCIQCYRCVRFYQDYAGGTDFGVTGSAGRVYFGRKEDGPLESPFSGNLVDICPTGVFTDKTGRFRARYWDYEMSSSVCPHCSVGCNIMPQAYHRELIKIAGRRNDQVNGWFICDRGRFDKSAVNHPQRPRWAKIDGQVTDVESALDALAQRIQEFIRTNGAGTLALIGSSRMSLEAATMLGSLARQLQGAHLCYFTDQATAKRSTAAVERVRKGGKAASLVDLAESDCIAIVCPDLLTEAAMLAPAIRKASLAGGRVYLVSREPGTEQPTPLPFPFATAASLGEVPLSEAKNGVIVCGSAEVDDLLLDEMSATGAKLALLQPGPNAFGAALLSLELGGISLQEALGKVKGVISFEADLPREMLQGITVVAAADWCAGDTAQSAGLFIPTTAWVESEGTFVNFEGRAQRFRRSMRTGLPLRGLESIYYQSEETPPPLHPPRVHRPTPPGGEAQDCWRVVARLLEKLGGDVVTDPWGGKWEALKHLDSEGPGLRLQEWAQ